ncbi:hypothetical protein [Ktedonospora formicarum]|uniref:Adenylate kinase n=1 Tax=Ktedonospora formicarum TaxID=2778364 RepID=A0A8J3HYZ7_9CHLR|nr:hypothetical protein [Ktedonospora formicarum]GHO46817.1 hypothetical protein KSX_49800 [Ktedonospora formicarum]
MVKIHILGGSGSGKTTLASDIAARLSIPHYELDTFGSKNGANDAAYIEDAFSIASQPSWVTEGIFLIWTEPLLYHANYIVLYEVPWTTAAWRIIFRHINKSLRGINPYPGFNGLKLLFKLLKDTRNHCLSREITDPTILEYQRLYLEGQREPADLLDAEYILVRLKKYFPVVFAPTAAFVHQYLMPYKHKVVLIRTNADRKRFLARIDALSQHNSSV